jgi:hypothetical protein
MNPIAGSIVAIPVASAWESKINWTQAVGLAISGLTMFTGALPPQYAVLGGLAVQTLQGLATWYFRTYQTATITPSSAAALTDQTRRIFTERLKLGERHE